MIAVLVCKSDLKNFDAFSDSILDPLCDEIDSLTSIVCIGKGEIVLMVQEFALLHRFYQPMTLVDVPLEVLKLGYGL